MEAAISYQGTTCYSYMPSLRACPRCLMEVTWQFVRRSQASHQPSVLGATADMPVALPYQRSQRSRIHERATCARYLSITRCSLPHLHLDLELEAGRPTVLQLCVHHSVCSASCRIGRYPTTRVVFCRRGRVTPPRIRFEPPSSIL